VVIVQSHTAARDTVCLATISYSLSRGFKRKECWLSGS